MRTCPHCGARQPSSFDAFCEACGRLLDETGQPPASDKVTAPGSLEARLNTSITETAPPPMVIPVADVTPSPRQRCPKCDAAQVIRNVRLTGAAEQSLAVTVDMNPDALLLKGAVTQWLTARVCGKCGYVEFYVAEPNVLLEAAPLTPERYGLAEPKRVHEQADGACLACGEPMPEDVTTCPACGWTYAAPEPS